MSTTTLLPGVRLHPNGASYQVRVRGFKPRSGFATPDEANEYATELRRRKRQGVLVAPEPEALSMTTLADVAREHLDRLASVGGRYGRAYSPDGLAEARKAARPWTGEPIPDRSSGARRSRRRQRPTSTDAVRGDAAGGAERPPGRGYLERRSAQTPRAAVGESSRSARSCARGASRREVRARAARAEPVRRRPRPKTHVPTLDEFRFLAARAPEHSRRLLLLGASLGGRIGELLAAEDAWVDLDGATIRSPSGRRRNAARRCSTSSRGVRPHPRAAARSLAEHGRRLRGLAPPVPATGRYAVALPLVVLEPRHRPDPHEGGEGVARGARHDRRRADAVRQLQAEGLPARRGDTHARAGDLARVGGVAARAQGRRSPARHGVRRDERENLRAELQAIAAEGGIDARLASRRLA